MSRKVILSRKGFDGTTGGKPSLIIDDRFVSLPIPRADSGDFYKNLNFSSTESYLKVMKDLGIKLYSEAHLDPDLQRSIINNRPDDWRGLFGQSGNSQGTLYNRIVGKGDLFLFFGWFKQAEKVNGKWRYINNAPDIHAIFGYLEVESVFDISGNTKVPNWITYHPHIRDKIDYGNQRNSVYMASKTFSIDKSKTGWGTFNYDPKLVLTKPGAQNKSLWKLPPCFIEEHDNFFHSKKIWNVLEDGCIEMQTSGRADQEMFISSNPEVVKWAEKLIKSCSSFE